MLRLKTFRLQPTVKCRFADRTTGIIRVRDGVTVRFKVRDQSTSTSANADVDVD